jgi:hypothetical protein
VQFLAPVAIYVSLQEPQAGDYGGLFWTKRRITFHRRRSNRKLVYTHRQTPEKKAGKFVPESK